MLTLNDLATYHVGFELFDLFGKGRIRELLYDLKLRISKDEEEIETWRSAYVDQSKAIKSLVEMQTEPSRVLQEENQRLRVALKKAQESNQALKEYAESLERKVVVGDKISTNVEHWTKEESA